MQECVAAFIVHMKFTRNLTNFEQIDKRIDAFQVKNKVAMFG